MTRPPPYPPPHADLPQTHGRVRRRTRLVLNYHERTDVTVPRDGGSDGPGISEHPCEEKADEHRRGGGDKLPGRLLPVYGPSHGGEVPRERGLRGVLVPTGRTGPNQEGIRGCGVPEQQAEERPRRAAGHQAGTRAID